MRKIITSLLLIMTTLLFAGCSNSGNKESAGSKGDNGDYSEPDPEPQERHCQYCGMSESEYDEFGYDCDYAEGHAWIY